jgi:signal peptidase I
MSGRRRPTVRRRLITGLTSLVLVLAWFTWLRPTSLGGQQTYVVVDGTSMEPTYHDGDFVLVRKEDRYAIGDIIAFRAGGVFHDPTRIIHRIVGSSDGYFITQGDNRDRADPWQPRPEEVLGRAVLHLPHAGDLARAGADPKVLAALGGAAVILGRSQRRRRRAGLSEPAKPGSGAPQPAPPRAAPTRQGSPRWMRHTEPRWAFLGLVTTVVLLVPVGLTLWSTIEATTSTIQLDHVGQVDDRISIDYRFVADPSPVYPTGVVATTESPIHTRAPTDPLYSRLLKRLELALDFRSEATGTEAFTSTYAIEVRASMPSGWSSAIATIDPTPFELGATRVVTVDLVAVAAQVAQVAELTGVGGDEYTISLVPTLTARASGRGATVEDALAPKVDFVVSGGIIHSQPLSDNVSSKELARQVRETTTYRLGPVAVQTPTARGLFAGLTLVLLGGAAWCSSVLFAGVGLSEADRIAARYRTQLVDVSSATGPPGQVVMVGGISELARLARIDQSVILHEDLGDGAHRYRVFLGAVTYEYETAPETGAGAHASEPLRETPPG